MKLNIVTLCDKDYLPEKEEYPEGIDIIFCLGDLTDKWLKDRMEQINPRYGTFGIRGNHDWEYPFPDGIVDLNFKSHTFEIEGESLTLAGVPGSWRYKPYGHWLFSQMEMDDRVPCLPRADILLSHNSPANIGHERQGESLQENPDGPHQGFSALNAYVVTHQPRFLFHGHQHLRKRSQLQETSIIGCYGEDTHSIRW